MALKKKKGAGIDDAGEVAKPKSGKGKAMLLGALNNQPGAARDIVALNAGASIYVCGQAETLAAGVERAFELIASGAARGSLEAFIKTSRQFA